MLTKLLRLLAFVFGVALLVQACAVDDGTNNVSSQQPQVSSQQPTNTLRIVAGSEQQAVYEQIIVPWAVSNDYNVEFTKKGSVDQALLLSSQGSAAPFDAFWFASSIFDAVGDPDGLLQSVEPMFSTPVVFAGRESVMQDLGFVGRSDVSIVEILEAVESNQVRAWMTNPTQSNSGSTMLMQYLSHFAGNEPGVPLTMEQLNSAPVEEGIARFVQSMDQTPPSTGTLVEECIIQAAICQTIFVYEALMIEQNIERERRGEEPFYVVYPAEGIAIADAPLGFLPHGTADDAAKRAIFDELQTFLLSDEAQEQLLELGRRPNSITGLSVSGPNAGSFRADWGIDADLRISTVAMPGADVISEALARYGSVYRSPGDAAWCLDSSGSMEGSRWSQLENGAATVFDQNSASDLYLEANPDDTTTVMIFSDGVNGGPWVALGDDAVEYSALINEILAHNTGGGTEMYECINAVLDILQDPTRDRPGRQMIIVMSDGESGTNMKAEVLDRLRTQDIPVIAVAFGNADNDQMRELADVSGGAVVSSSDLVAALRKALGFR